MFFVGDFRSMYELKRNCPHCGASCHVTEITSGQAKRCGLVYLRMKCVTCNIMVEGAGSGERDAVNDLDKSAMLRKGTSPEQWRIRPRNTRRRRNGYRPNQNR
jgi:hypothetical protein